jgi:hypothetical protein
VARGQSSFKVNIDAQELGKLARDLKALEGGKKQVAALRKSLKAAAEPAAAQVRRNASWSSRIPGAVGVQPRFSSKNPAVSIFVSRTKAPHARPIENSGKGGTFSHPVFGRTRRGGRRYVTARQTARPFFFNQLERHMPAVERAVLDAMDEAARAAGFR